MRAAGRFWRFSNPACWLIGVVFIATFACAFNSSPVSLSLQALVFVVGVVLGKAASSWAAWQRPSESVTSLMLNVLILLLSIASFWHFDTFRSFEYRSQMRWTGLGGNPNMFGLLMGAGVVLSLGRVVECLISNLQGEVEVVSRKSRTERCGRWFFTVFGFCAAIFMGRGLWHSYSRGAWVATILGLVYLGCRVVRSQSSTECRTWTASISNDSIISRFSTWSYRNRMSVFAITLAVGILVFWQFRHSNHELVASRAYSVANVNDFAWRNRVAAWKGTLQIMADHAGLGAGWSQPERLYQYYYLLPKLDESGAIQTNDYLTMGATLGVPALFCLSMYLWLLLVGEPGTQKMDWPRMTCAAGAVVLLVGFWFDGGLFTLATASTFWILLELGNVETTPKVEC